MASSLTWGRRSRAPWRGLAALLLAACAALCLFVVEERASAQDPLGAPTIGTVTITPVSLTVNWSAPSETGGSAITAYDVRYILTSATDKADEHWTLARVTGGSTLQHVVTGLRDSTSYDIQVRAVNADADGPWSTPARTVVTTDHGGTRASATPLALASPVEGRIEPATDVDRFRIRVTAQTYVWIYSTGALDTTATLYSASSARVASNDDAHAVHGTRNFGMAATLAANADYVLEVRAGGAEDVGLYTVHVIAPAVSTNRYQDAPEITPGIPARGDTSRHASPFTGDWFKFSLTELADVWVTAVPDKDEEGKHQELYVAIYRGVGLRSVIGGSSRMFEFVVGGSAARRYIPLDAGDYYVRAERDVTSGEPAGPHTLYLQVAADPGASKAGATALVPYRLETGWLSSASDADYFTFTLDREEMFRANIVTRGFTDIPAVSIVDETDTERPIFIEKRDHISYSIFPMRARLPAGTYYLRIAAQPGQFGTYFIESILEEDYRTLLETCAGGSLSDSLSGCQWHLAAINVQSVWETGGPAGTGIDGEGITVVVVDVGIQIDHEDLAENVHETGHHDYVGTGIYHSGYSHGTAMAGIIAAKDNGFGVRGVAPGVKLYSNNVVRDFDRDPRLSTYHSAPDAMTRNMVDVAVSSNSYSPADQGRSYQASEAWETAVEMGLKEGFNGKGISYVFSAGNTGNNFGNLPTNYGNSNLDGWANFYGVMAVCAVHEGTLQTSYSEVGANLWVCGPSGEPFRREIMTTRMSNRYGTTTGTSAATAVVSGVAALVRAANPALTWRDVKLILAGSAQYPALLTAPQGALQYGSSSERYSQSHNFGFGTVDAAAAVALAGGWTLLPSFREAEAESGPLDLSIPDGGTLSLTLSLGRYVDFVEFIEVELHFDHEIRAMNVKLESPSSAVSQLAYRLPARTLNSLSSLRQRPGSHQFGSARHLGESAGGTWTLTISNLKGFRGGVLESWRIKAYGHGFTPGFPPIPTATSGMRTLTIDWSAPTDLAGAAITSYDLRYIRSDASGKGDPANWTEVAGIGTDDTGTYEITGLGPGVQYDLKVRAANDTGPGPWSESLVVRSSLEQPFAPSIDTVSPRDMGLGATWTAPTEDGGSEITSYDLRTIRSNASQTDKDDPTNWDETFSAWTPLDGDLQGRVAGLTNGVDEYDVQVRARNAIGVSDWSETLKGTPAIQNTDASFADDTADREVAENLREGVNVGARVSATDPDRDDPLTYSILGGSNDFFEIDAMNGQLRTKVELDADEGVTSHTLTVEVSDGLNSSDDEDLTIDDSIEVTITVTNVNERPVVDGTRTIDHAENEGTALANARYSATDPERANITWSLGGIDKGFFAISSGGELSFAAEPDFDIKGDHNRDNTYEVTVRATEEDDGDRQTPELTGTLAVTVTLTDVNEPPVVRRRSGTGAFSIVENSGPDVGRFVATDPEGQGVTWSLETTGDHGRFEIDEVNGALSLKETADYESSDLGSDKAYTVTVQATEVDDGDALTSELTGSLDVTVTITNVNEPPVVRRSSGMGAFSIDENSGTAVGAFDADDPEGQGVTWSLATSGDHGRFQIDANGALSFKMPPDYESSDIGRDKAYNVTVQATEEDDGDPLTRELTGRLDVTVGVIDVNEPPVITPVIAGRESVTVNEGHAGELARYAKRDPDGDLTNWARVGETAALGGADAGAFEFDKARGALSFTAPPDFEQRASYEVSLRANDGTNDAELVITVAITNLEERGAVTFDRERPILNLLLTATLEDPDGVVGAESWTWQRSTSGSGGWGEPLAGAVSNVFTPLAADRDHYLRATVEYSDAHGAQTERAVTGLPAANIPAGNKAPVLPDSVEPISIPENTRAGSTVGGPVRASDEDLDPLSYSLQGSSDFVIDSRTGQIRVADRVVLDFEEGQTSYTLTVGVDDGFEGRDSVTVTVTITDVNEAPVASDDAAATDEDEVVVVRVLDNDRDPENDDLEVIRVTAPQDGAAEVDAGGQTITYTPRADYHGADSFAYIVNGGDQALVTVTVNPVNDAPAFAAATAERSVSENAQPGANVGVPVTATDVDGDRLSYRLGGVDADSFEIDEFTGQLSVSEQASLIVATEYAVTVTADDGSREANATATVDVTITVTARPPIIIITGGGGGGGGGGGPSPSEVDFEWTVKHDIEELDGGNDWPTGLWSDGETLWIAENGQGADDEVYAYDRASGERLSEREFTLAETNRAPRGFWSDGETVWVSDSGRERLFAYRLADGERLEEREFALAAGNSDARGIWSDHETMWVLDGRADALFAYALASGELLAEYALDSANSDPHGLWSDGVTVWVSDHGAKRLFAYRLEGEELTRNRDEEFGELSQASNNSPRGIWSDGDFMYVADESDDRVYTYNMPDAIDARLASLTLSGVDIGEFDPARTDYEGSVGEGVTETVVTAEAMQRRTDVAIDPPDADGDDANGHQVALAGLAEITVTVTSADGSRKKVYRVQFPEAGWDPARDPWPHCLRGAVSEGFSLVVHEGGSVEELVSCAESRGIVAVYALHDGAYVSYILGAPDFVNREFRELFADGLPPITPLVAGSDGPPSADPFGDLDDGGQQPWPQCLRGAVAAGFSLVVYEGGSVDELVVCAESMDLTALYTLSEGEFVSYILGAPELVNQPFRDLFAGGLPSVTPLVARSEGQP